MNNKAKKSYLDFRKLILCAAKGEPLTSQDISSLNEDQVQNKTNEWIDALCKNSNVPLKDINHESIVTTMISLTLKAATDDHNMEGLKETSFKITAALDFLGKKVKELEKNYDKVLRTMDIAIGKKKTTKNK